MEGGLSQERYRHQQDVLPCMVYSRDTEVSFLMSYNLKVTQYMDQKPSQLYSIWISVPKVLYGYVAPSKERLMIYVA